MSNAISRRELLKWASAGAGAAAVGIGTYAIGRGDAPTPAGVLAEPGPASDSTTARRPENTAAAPPASPSTTPAATDLSQRLLVVVEMAGGNDGMSMVVPYGDGTYYDLRQTTAIGEGDVLAIDDQFGFHPSLPSLHQRGAAIVQGVGSFESDGSHFEMLARWWSGSPSPSGTRDTGFLGRLADAIGDPSAPAVALSVGTGTTPAILSRAVSTLAIPGADAAGYLAGAGEDDWFRRLFQQTVAAFGSADPFGDLDARLRATTAQSLAFAEVLAALTADEEDPYPYSDLGRGLRLAAQLFSAGQGVRIVHVPMHQDFDTHDDHNGRYPGIMQDLDESLSVFLNDLAARGLSDRVLVMTTSEFGRTARDNGSGGLDHGTASNALLIGPVVPGRYGEAPSLAVRDDNDNLKATMGFDTYYATVAEGWFGVPASDVLDTGATPLEGVFS